MEPQVGVLLDKSVLRKAIRGHSVFERVDLYVKAGAELGIRVILFDIAAVNFKERRVTGYESNGKGGYKRVKVPMPKVVHNRTMYSSNSTGPRLLKRLERQGVYVFNPLIDRDKYRMHKLLYKNDALHKYLPETERFRQERYKWFASQLESHGEVFIKPRLGSLGAGIARVSRIRKGVYRYESGSTSVKASLRRVWRLARRGRQYGYLLQMGIPLAEIRGHRYDLRVPVQRDERGEWQVPGMAAKRAENHPFLTNIARGGSALTVREAFRQSLEGVSAAALMGEIKNLALTVARTLSQHYPRLADIGLDVGVDRNGRPYLIEVNRRDLRIILAQAGEDKVYANLYRNPIAYAGYLLRNELKDPS